MNPQITGTPATNHEEQNVLPTTREPQQQQQQQINVVEDTTLQALLSSLSEEEVHVFIDELNKTGKAYLPSIGQTIELLTVQAPVEIAPPPPPPTTTTTAQPSADTLLQELTTLIQQPPVDIVPINIEQKVSAPPSRTGNTAVKSTVTSHNNATIRKPIQQQHQQQQIANDERVFFGRPTTIGQGQYHNRTGLMPGHKQQPQQPMSSQQRRPISWFQNRARRHSSDDDDDSDRDSSPPISSSDSLGPTRRSARVPKPKQDADFVTFPLLDRDENGNPIPPTPSSMPLNRTEDDEDDIPYRLMDYPRPPQQQNQQSQLSSSGPGRKPRATAEIRSSSNVNKKQARWPDDEMYHVKSFVPLIMPQQIINPATMKNKMTLCKPLVSEREVEAKPTRFTIATQTEMENMIPDVPLVSLPVPIYLPSPTPSYRLFKPRAVPIPVPFFVPIMIPVQRSTFKNIRDYLQTQRDLLPDDPFEAALVMHAESLARAESQPQQTLNTAHESVMMMDLTRDDSFMATSQTVENLPELDLEAHYIDPVTSSDPEVQKLLRMLPDAECRLKWTYGVEAFQQWCAQRNRSIMAVTPDAEIAKQYFCKSDLIAYVNGDELQQVMDVFIREVRRPTGEQYLPESIYYLCLGIQFYLNMHNRQIDIFDPRHIEFNSTLNGILQTYSPRVLEESNKIVSLIDEDILYDVHQLGTLTPWSLLTTLFYTNSKYFNLKTAESHMAISFANFGKYSQWVRLTANSPQGQQMNYLRFYAHNPDLKALVNLPTFYEITEYLNDPVRCPIKQYDFYVSKCPEQIRGTADVFYLRPISEQVHENSIWYSNESLSPTIIDQILNRLKLIPDFYNQTKPVESAAASSNGNTSAGPSTTTLANN